MSKFSTNSYPKVSLSAAFPPSPLRGGRGGVVEETGYSYFGARYYSPEISVWLSVDPLASVYPSTSSYMYCLGNPIVLIDPDGRSASPILDEAGNLLGTDNQGWTGKAIVMNKNDFTPGMDHGDAQSKGTELDKYSKGISVSDKTWNTIESNDGGRMSPTLSNNSDYSIFFKPEGLKNGVDNNPGYSSSEAYSLEAGKDLYAQFDGVAAPHLKTGQVFKATDGVNVTVSNSGLSTSYISPKAWAGYMLLGGWKGVGWLNELSANSVEAYYTNPELRTSSYSNSPKNADYSWISLFGKSGLKNAENYRKPHSIRKIY